MNRFQQYKSNIFTNFVKLVSNDRLNILAIDDLAKENPQYLRTIAKEIGIKVKGKSNVIIAEEIMALARVFLAGQGKNIYS